MLGWAADLPESLVRFPPVRDGGLDLTYQHRPPAVVQPVAGTSVQIDRVQQDAPDVMLALIPGAVADANRPGAVIARQVIKSLLGQFPLAADPVHDLQVGILFGEVGEEVEEVVGFPVESQRVQAPEHERRITQPGVAVIVVTVPAGGLRQRRGRRGQQRAGGRVDQALERQRGPLQVLAPRMIWEIAPADPPVPEIRCDGQPLMSLGEGLGRGAVSPGQCAEDLLSGPQAVPRDRPRALEPQVQVGGQPDLRFVAQPATSASP